MLISYFGLGVLLTFSTHLLFTMDRSPIKLNTNRWLIIVRFILLVAIILAKKYIGIDAALVLVFILLLWSLINFIIQRKNMATQQR